jgi:hypothetical protein
LEIFGKNVSGMGDHPVVIRIDGDSRGHDEELSMLQMWYGRFQEIGPDISNEIIDVGVKYKEASAEHSALLARMPRTEEEFTRRIEESRRKLISAMLVWSVNMTRFFHDFIGKPITNAGYLPTAAEFKGPGLQYLISSADFAIITEYPTLPLEHVIERIFPKSRDDINV